MRKSSLALIAILFSPLWATGQSMPSLVDASTAPPSVSSLTPMISLSGAVEVVTDPISGTIQAGASLAPAPTASQGPTFEAQGNTFTPDQGINNSGNFTYNVPIWVPRVAGEISHPLSIRYDSSAPDTLLGLGMRLEGFSSVTRDPSFAIDFTASDHYALDGLKLYKDAVSKTYHPERETFDRIEVISPTNDATGMPDPNHSAAYWVVSKRDGSRWEYRSIQAGVGRSTKTVEWSVTSVTDRYGNMYLVDYMTDSDSAGNSTGAYYPKKISLFSSGNTSVDLGYYISFFYESRSTALVQNYPANKRTELRLKQIVVSYGSRVENANVGGALRGYQMTYSPAAADGQLRLASVTEWKLPTKVVAGQDFSTVTGAVARPATTFQWPAWVFAGAITKLLVGDSSAYSTGNSKLFLADFNGDGLTDILRQKRGSTTSSDANILQVQYSDGLGGFSMQEVSGSWSSQDGFCDIIPGDFNGDGRTDFLRQEKAHAADDDVHTLDLFLAGTQGFTNSTVYAPHGYKAEWANIITGDFNGDGCLDFLRQEKDYADDNGVDIFRMYLGSRNLGNEGIGFTFVKLQNLDGKPRGGDNLIVRVADLDGDGADDLLVQEYGVYATDDSGTIQAWLSNRKGGFATYTVLNEALYNGVNTKLIVGDYDGDGRQDFLIQKITDDPLVTSTLSLIGMRSIDGKTFSKSTIATGLDYLASNATLKTGDFNADGRTDILRQEIGDYVDGSNTVTCGISRNAFSISFATIANAVSWGSAEATLQVGDLNGDGLSDFFLQAGGNAASDGKSVFVAYYSRGDGTFAGSNLSDSTQYRTEYCKLYAFDLDGDGMPEFLRQETNDPAVHDNTNTLSVYSVAIAPTKVTNVKLPSKATILVTYKGIGLFQNAVLPLAALPSFGGLFTGAPTEEIPFVKPDSRGRLVASLIEIKYGQDPGSKVEFGYVNGLRQLGKRSERRGLGFQAVTMRWLSDQRYLVREFYQRYPMQSLVSRETLYGGNGRAFRQTATRYDLKLPHSDQANADSVFLFVSTQSTNAFDGISNVLALQSRVENRYSDDGLLTETYNWGFLDSNGQTDTKALRTTVYSYVKDASGVIVAPARVQTFASDDNGTPIETGRVESYYDGAEPTLAATAQVLRSGKLSSTVRFLGETKKAITKLVRDPFGNVIQVFEPLNSSFSSASPLPTITYEFDSSFHSLPAKVTRVNDLGVALSSTTQYLPGGFLGSEANENGYTMTYTYDGFGRVLTAHGTDGSDSTWKYVDLPESHPMAVSVTKSTRESTTSGYRLVEIQFVDQLGRVAETKAGRENGGLLKLTTSVTGFDSDGRVREVYRPYQSASFDYDPPNPLLPHTIQTFDPLGRSVEVLTADGARSLHRYIYDTVFDLDPEGHLSSVQIANGTTTKTRWLGTYSEGFTLPNAIASRVITLERGLTRTTSSDGSTVSNEGFDWAGNRLTYSSVDAGSWNYEYDLASNLTGQIGPNGVQQRWTYDRLNRPKTKTYSDGTPGVTYLYDVNAGGTTTGYLGRIAKVSFGADSEEYTYDLQGQVSRLQRTILGISEPISRTYDLLGREESLSAKGQTVLRTYGDDGNLSGVWLNKGTSNERPVATQFTYTPSGKLAGYLQGSGAVVELNYFDNPASIDPFSNLMQSERLASIRASKSNLVLVSRTYGYSISGNPKLITSNDGSHSYWYDDRDELTSDSGPEGTKSWTYDREGRLVATQSDHPLFFPSTSHRLVTVGTLGLAYGNAGERLSSSENGVTKFSYLYDGNYRLTRVTGTDGEPIGEMTYNQERQRLSKVEGATITRYWTDEVREVNGLATVSIKGSGLLVAELVGDQLSFPVQDHLGTILAKVDASGQVSDETKTSAYGKLSGATSDGTYFTGQLWDKAFELNYFNARYYDSNLGQFTQPDPALWDASYYGKVELSPEEMVNPYLYAMNNPMRYTDPTGLDFGMGFDANQAGGNGHTYLYFQGGNGSWYRLSVGAAGTTSSGDNGFITGSNAPAGASITRLSASPGGVTTIKTTKEQDRLIASSAKGVADAFNSGKEEYNLYTNSCTDAAIVAVNGSGAGVSVPDKTLFTLRPNDYAKTYKDFANKNQDQTKGSPSNNSGNKASSGPSFLDMIVSFFTGSTEKKNAN